MRIRWMQRALLVAGSVALVAAAACAQTDVAVSLYGAFNGTTTGNNTVQSPSNAAGGLIEVRHITHPWLGYEGTYSYNRANQKYSLSAVPAVCPPTGCGITAASVSANAHEVTADWVASLMISNLRPFALAGGGILFDAPVSGQTGASSTTKPVFVYGGGLDWGLLPHLGLRLQYRGNLYKAPDLTTLFTSASRFTHTSEPMLGAYFRF